ncbi:MAG TPA: response regulator transcription factor [Flavobacterium sp.]
MNSTEPYTKNVIIVDDHPMTVDSYVALLSSMATNSDTVFHLAYDGENAYDLLKKMRKAGTNPDIAFLDVNLPPYPEKNIDSGVDIGTLIRKYFPTCKIVFITMHKEPVWVNRIFKSLNPEGFISKNEINYRTFPEVYQKILEGEFYYSASITESQRFFIQKNIDWDEYDSKILLLIAEGKKTVNLPEYIGLSLSTIEKRKANIKKQLIFEGGSDQELIEIAKKLGLV